MEEFKFSVLESVAQSRLLAARDQISRSLVQVAHGNPLGAETDPGRMIARLARKGDMSEALATNVARTVEVARERVAMSDGRADALDGREAVIGDTIDFVGVAFLTIGRRAADCVVRIAYRNGKALGSGFLVAPNVIITNNHVIDDPGLADDLVAEFDHERDEAGGFRPPSRYELDSRRLFVTDPIDRLDYTLIGLGRRIDGPRDLMSLTPLVLSDASDKHMLGEVANVIQHPKGDYKQLVLRENRLVARQGPMLFYVADTDRGSSGSPVFNNEWQVIALHHWGGASPALRAVLPPTTRITFNEGVRISTIVADLKSRRQNGGPNAASIGDLLDYWARADRSGNGVPVSRPAIRTSTKTANIANERAIMGSRRDEDFSDRAGYETGFIPGCHIPLPSLKGVKFRPARNLDARIGEDPHELRYHHFSIVMNAVRRCAYFTACNIDGSTIRGINRETKTVNEDPTIVDLQVERLEAAEAADDFALDPRVHEDEQMGIEMYRQQRVHGYADPQDRQRIARMFQKGHIVMRSDPAWGPVEMAKLAERDTFFYTNAAPQLGFFNQGSPVNRPGAKGRLRWRAVETYVLRNARTMRARVSVFAGPVFADDDPEYRGVKIPMSFWKIAMWADPRRDGRVRSIALLAEQKTVLERLTNGIPEAMGRLDVLSGPSPERFDEIAELKRVSEFLTTVEHIEALTGLGFPDLVRDGDLRAGESTAHSIANDGEIDLDREPLRVAAKATAANEPPAKRLATKRLRRRSERRPMPEK
jgi:endonuclease G